MALIVKVVCECDFAFYSLLEGATLCIETDDNGLPFAFGSRSQALVTMRSLVIVMSQYLHVVS